MGLRSRALDFLVRNGEWRSEQVLYWDMCISIYIYIFTCANIYIYVDVGMIAGTHSRFEVSVVPSTKVLLSGGSSTSCVWRTRGFGGECSKRLRS